MFLPRELLGGVFGLKALFGYRGAFDRPAIGRGLAEVGREQLGQRVDGVLGIVADGFKGHAVALVSSQPEKL